MKILYVLEYYYPYIGGSEKLFTTLAESMAFKGYSVQVITTRFRKELPEFEVINGVHVHRINSKTRYSFTLRALPAICKRRKSFDIIHTTTYNAALPSWIAGKILNKSTILTFHELWGNLWFRLPYASPIQKIAFYSFEKMITLLPFNHYIAVSKFTQSELIRYGISEKTITQIYNGIDLSKLERYNYSPKYALPHRLVYFGRLGISKGLDIILEGVKILSIEGWDIRLILIVPRLPLDMWKKINTHIDELGIRHLVEFNHDLSEDHLFRKIASCDVALIPSYSEGFCFSAVEAAQIGIPIVHSGRGSLGEVLSEREHSLKAIDVPSFCENVRYELTTPLEQKSIIAKDWSLENSIASYIELYENLRSR